VSVGEPVRVVRIIARLNVGGPALHVSYLARGLASRGYATTLLAGQIASGESSMAFVADELGVEIEPIATLRRELSPLDDLRTLVRIVRVLRRVRPQILHTHTAKAGTLGRVASLLAGSARPPIVIHTFHGHVLRGYFSPAVTTVYRTLERVLARFTTRLVAVSPETRDELVALGVSPAERFSVIRLGLDLEQRVASAPGAAHALRDRLGIAADVFVIGWVGRMTAIKNVPDVLAAFAELRERGVEATLCLVGDGPERASVEQRAHELGIEDHVVFAGYEHELGAYYELFDVLVLTSANEGTPVVAIEALAKGTPVVATAVGGVGDVVSDGVDGVLVTVGDVVAIATALERLAHDPELGRRMGAVGAKRAGDRYRVERLVDDIDALYRELLTDAGLPLPPGSSGPPLPQAPPGVER
jgi:glycosyltransferase involved in cell wall biosynthesis